MTIGGSLNRSIVLILTAFSVALLSSCMRPPIDELARNSIKEKAVEALESYTRIAQSTARESRDLVGTELSEEMPGMYSLTWSNEGWPLVDIYLRDHVTTSGGFWGEQWTASACVRYSHDGQTAGMKSTDCPDAGIQSTHTDERVVIP